MDNAVYVRGQVRETCIALFTLHARLSLSLSLSNDLATYEKCHFSFVSDRWYLVSVGDKMYALFVYQEVRSS